MGMSMVERIALVLNDFRIDGDDGYSNKYVVKIICNEMRVPTEAMAEAAFNSSAFQCAGKGEIVAGWSEMIKAADKK